MHTTARPPDRPTTPPEVPGYRAGPPVAHGPQGPSWAVTGADGTPAVLSVLRLPAGQQGEAVLHRLAGLRDAPIPNLARVLQVHGCAPGRGALVTEPVAGPLLQDVLAARGPLSRTEVATLGRVLGAALHQLHLRGLVHGNVGPGSVVMTSGGPVLADLVGEGPGAGYAAPEQVAGGHGSAVGDVWALGRVLRSCAPDDAEVAATLAPVLVPDPRDRPGASWFADLALSDPPAAPRDGAAAPGAPGSAVLPPPARRRHRRSASPTRRRRWLAGALVVASAGVSGSVTTVALTGKPADMAGVVAGLVADRDRALVAGDRAQLARLTVPGSAAAATDTALLAQLEATATEPTHLRTHVESVRVVRHGTTEVVAEALLRQGRSERRRADGTIEHLPAPPPRCVRLTLAGPSPWRVRAADPCPALPSDPGRR